MKSLVLVCLLFGVVTCRGYGSHRAEEDRKDVIYRAVRGIKNSRIRGGDCRYKKGPWEPCDLVTNTEQRTLTLKRGDSTCEPSRILTRKCKKACKYEKGEWKECDAVSNERTRIDKLKPKSDSSCENTRKITKKCKKTCQYNRKVDWSRCDTNTGQKVKVMDLMQGDPSICEPTRIVKKPCGKKGKNKKVSDDYEDYE